MKFQFPAYFFLFLLNISCSEPPRQTLPAGSKNESKAATKNKPPGSFSDTVNIIVPSAVFFHPDSLQIEKIKSITDTGIFKSTMHEIFYQMRYSRIFIKKHYPHIKIIEVTRARFLLFEKAGGRKEFIDLNTINDPGGLFIFDRFKAPHLADMTNVETELGFYFAQ